MGKGPKLQAIEISEGQTQVLEQLVRRHQTPQQLAKRARVVLLAVQGHGNRDISREIQLDRMQVGVWRKRWITEYEQLCQVEAQHPDQLVAAIQAVLSDAPRSGAPATFTAEQIIQIVALACEPPEDSERPISHWTTRELADEAIKRGIVDTISERQVGRFLKSGGSQTPSESVLAQC